MRYSLKVELPWMPVVGMSAPWYAAQVAELYSYLKSEIEQNEPIIIERVLGILPLNPTNTRAFDKLKARGSLNYDGDAYTNVGTGIEVPFDDYNLGLVKVSFPRVLSFTTEFDDTQILLEWLSDNPPISVHIPNLRNNTTLKITDFSIELITIYNDKVEVEIHAPKPIPLNAKLVIDTRSTSLLRADELDFNSSCGCQSPDDNRCFFYENRNSFNVVVVTFAQPGHERGHGAIRPGEGKEIIAKAGDNVEVRKQDTSGPVVESWRLN